MLKSPFCMVEFDGWSTLHHVLEGSQLIRFVSARVSEMGFGARSIFWVALLSKRRSGVISLISVGSQPLIFWATSLGKSPAREILFVRWLSTSLGDVSARADRSGGGGLVLQSLSSSETESKFLRLFVNWFFFWKVLRSWIMLEIVSGESWLSTYLWG
jgi:hypothetical protein